jgi:phenylpropionate dioxygenase-like ring-hydroxylating dioxygenase large terminal subunit
VKHEAQIELIHHMLDLIDNKETDRAKRVLKSPASSFTSKELARQEWKAFFESRPQVIGLTADLPAPGSFITNNDLRIPILATRDESGKFRAFLNSCRHRGALVAREDRGQSSRFSCIFHGWTYANDGDLLGIRKQESFGPAEKSCLGLIELQSIEKYGLLMVRLTGDEPIDADAHLGEELTTQLATWDLGASTYLGMQRIDKPLNWKLANDTYGETYHFSNLHSETVYKIFYGDSSEFSAYGLNHRITVPNRYLAILRDRPQSQWNATDAAAVTYFIFPNIHIVMFNRVVSVFAIYPDPEDPGQSFTHVSHYGAQHIGAEVADVPAAELTRGDALYQADNSTRVEFNKDAAEELADSTIADEDYWAGSMTQISANSGRVDYFLLGQNEAGVQHMHSAYRSALGLTPLEELAAGAQMPRTIEVEVQRCA